MADIYVNSLKWGSKSAIVDDDDYEKVNSYKWYLRKHRNTYYAISHIKYGFREYGKLYMHHLVFPLTNGYVTDHIDGNGLNNKKENLRHCTIAENCRNNKLPKNNTSGYKGVSYFSKSNKWFSKIMFNRKAYQLGLFDTKEDAALAYDLKAIELFGKFARCNFDSSRECINA